jgi:hypothetical protein
MFKLGSVRRMEREGILRGKKRKRKTDARLSLAPFGRCAGMKGTREIVERSVGSP